MYVQINILILRANGAEEIPSIMVIIQRPIQRSKPQKKHVRITANVIVLKIGGKDGIYIKTFGFLTCRDQAVG